MGLKVEKHGFQMKRNNNNVLSQNIQSEESLLTQQPVCRFSWVKRFTLLCLVVFVTTERHVVTTRCSLALNELIPHPHLFPMKPECNICLKGFSYSQQTSPLQQIPLTCTSLTSTFHPFFFLLFFLFFSFCLRQTFSLFVFLLLFFCTVIPIALLNQCQKMTIRYLFCMTEAG